MTGVQTCALPISPAFLCLVLTHPGSELRTVSFVCFMNHLGTFRPNLGFFYQPNEPVGNRFNRFSTMAGWLYQSWGIPDLSLFGSHSSGLRIECCCFCLIPYSFRSLLKKIGNFSQQVVPVENWFNLFCKRTLGSPWFWHFSSLYPFAMGHLWAILKV